jgi:hypothetical protein
MSSQLYSAATDLQHACNTSATVAQLYSHVKSAVLSFTRFLNQLYSALLHTQNRWPARLSTSAHAKTTRKTTPFFVQLKNSKTQFVLYVPLKKQKRWRAHSLTSAHASTHETTRYIAPAASWKASSDTLARLKRYSVVK